MNERRLEANRSNALKSTGPKSPARKARSSKHSLKLALFAGPVVVGLESRKAWEEHLNAVRASINPVGYIEEYLTYRLAVVMAIVKKLTEGGVNFIARWAMSLNIDGDREWPFSCWRNLIQALSVSVREAKEKQPANKRQAVQDQVDVRESIREVAAVEVDSIPETARKIWNGVKNATKSLTAEGIPSFASMRAD